MSFSQTWTCNFQLASSTIPEHCGPLATLFSIRLEAGIARRFNVRGNQLPSYRQLEPAGNARL